MTTEWRAVQTHYSFLIRIWAEPREIAGAPDVWRGSIEEVITGERCYFVNLNQIEAYVRGFLKPESLDSTPLEP